MRFRPIIPTSLVLVSLLLGMAAWAADWPMLRHDINRSGWQPTPGAISAPTVAWSLDLGSLYRNGEVLIDDVTGNGRKDIATVVGGKVVLRSADNRIVWSSGSLGISRILSLTDFDRDGRRELLAVRDSVPPALVILDGRTGEVRWLFDGFDSNAQYFAPGLILVTDLDGDNAPDILASPNGQTTVFAFSFSDGYNAATPDRNTLWTYAQQVYGKTTPFVAGDLTNDGRTEVAFFENYRLTVIDGVTGDEVWVNDQAFSFYSIGMIQLARVDSDPHQKIVAIGSSAAYNLAISVFDVVRREIQWQIQWYPPNDKRLVYTDESLADFNGNGRMELAVSVFNNVDDELGSVGSTPGQVDGIQAPNQWTTILYSAADGSVVATIPNTVIRGVRDLNGDGLPELLLQHTQAGTSAYRAFGLLSAYSLVGNLPVQRWTIADAAPAGLLPPLRAQHNNMGLAQRIAAQDIDGDGKRELYLWIDADGDSRADALHVYNADLEEPTLALEPFPVPAGEFASLVAIGNELSGPGQLFQTAIAVTDGYLHLYDRTFVRQAAVRLGGYVTEPLVADLDGDGVPELIVAGANRALRVYDASAASASRQPQLLWSHPGWQWPVLVTDDLRGDGKRVIPVCACGDILNPRVELLDATGDRLWERSFAGYGSAPLDYVFGRFDNDNVRDLLVVITDASRPSAQDMRLVALSGADGSEIWNIAPQTNRYYRFPLLLHDVTGDGLDDLIFVDNTQVEYYSGQDGSFLGGYSDTDWSLNHLLADFNKDGDLDLLLVNARADYGLKLVDLLATAATRTIPMNYNEEVGTRWVGLADWADDELHLLIPNGFGKLTVTGAVSGATYSRYIRGGATHPTDPGGLNDLRGVISCDINDDGLPNAIFGSSDGYLMALDLPSGEALFALNLGNPTGSPVAADLTNDGASDLLVSTYDGRLHLITQATLPPPEVVRDVAVTDDLRIADPLTDIDITGNTAALGATWSSVAEADGYAYAIFDQTGNQIVPWTNNGASTQIILSLNLVPGETYIAGVRAYDDSGRSSVPAHSDGVQLVDLEPPLVEDLTVNPAVFNPVRGGTRFTARLSDSTALVGMELLILGPTGGEIYRENRLLNTRLYMLDYTWSGMRDGLPLADGVYTFVVTGLDFGGNFATGTVPVVLDKQPPEPPVIHEPVGGERFGQGAIPVAGDSEAGHVWVFLDAMSAAACEATVDESGLWACMIDFSLDDGEHSVRAQAEDLAGNLSLLSEAVTFLVDRTPPDAPQIDSPAEGEVIKTSRFEIRGQTEARAWVVTYLVPSEQVLCRTAADDEGLFACLSEPALRDGDYQLSALAADDLNNVSTAAAPRRFTIATGSEADGDEPDGDEPDGDEPDGDGPDGDEPDGDYPDGDEPDGDADGDADGDTPWIDPGPVEGCGGCTATEGNISALLLTLTLLLPWLRRRRKLA